MHWLDTAHALSEITRTTLSLFLSCLRLVSCVLVSALNVRVALDLPNFPSTR